MANKRRRKRRKTTAKRRRRRRRNPVVNMRRTRRYRSSNMRRKRRRSRNPSLARALPGVDLFKDAFAAIGGGVLTRAIPQAVLREKNTGAVGYLANGVVALGISWGAGKFIGKRVGQMALLGGAVMIVGRAIEDFAQTQLVAFGALPGLSGQDPAYGFLSGEYVPYNFPVPTSSLPQVTALAPAGNGSGVSGPWHNPWDQSYN